MSSDLIIQVPSGEVWSLSYEIIRSMPSFAHVADVSKLDPKKEGRAVYLSALLPDDERDEAKYVTLIAEGGGFSASLKLDDVIDSALVIFELGRGPLPAEKGGAFRFWVPNAAACNTAAVDRCANVKGLEKIEFSATPGADSRSKKYEERGC